MNIAINGFGRIGRTFFRQAFGKKGIAIVGINDLGDVSNLAYLLKHDSVYRTYEQDVKTSGDMLVVGKNKIAVFHEKDPAKLPWKQLNVDIVIESTGVFMTTEAVAPHLKAGAKRVVISAPAKDDTPTATPNLNFNALSRSNVSSNASCTTNATNPVVAVLMKELGIQKGMLTTVHGYTATQKIVDGPDAKDFARGRAAAVNIIPTSTGAADAVERVMPEVKGKFDGIAMRVPVATGSIIDFTFLTGRDTTKEEVNEILTRAAASKEWNGILQVANEPLVSTDIIGSPFGSIVDPSLTRVVDGNLVKVCAWYDNEWGYCAMLLKHVESLATLLK
jgi:glyceraldehyde 3-phosphate dehydrogenase